MKTGQFYKPKKYPSRVSAPLFLIILWAILFAPGAMAQTQHPILPVIIENNFISNNTAESGGGLGIYNASPLLRNNLLIENTSTGPVGGGAIYSFGSTSNPSITGNTLSNNRAASGQGGGIYAAEGRPVISNTILWQNQGDLFNCTASYSDLTTASPGTGNISADPAFVQVSDPNAPGFYRLSDVSPCIDQGDPSYQVSIAEMDIDGHTRLAGGRIDIGADELPDAKGPTISNVTYNGINLIDGMVLQQSGLFSLSATDPSSVSKAEFLLDGNIICTDTDGSNGYTCSWSIHQTSDGAHTLTLSAYDSLGNSSSLSYAFNVALNPPPAPEIRSPLNGTVFRTVNITVAGRADNATSVILYQNDVQILSPIAVDSSGNFSFSLTLAEGVNRLRAAAGNRIGTGPMSTEVLVTLDTSLPKAPVNLLAQSRPGGMIGLTWTAQTGTQVKGYFIYRSSTPFSSTSEASRVNSNPVAGTSLDNLPPSDGPYYYAVSTVDQANQESLLSNLASAVSDRTPPWAVSIEYMPSGPYSSSPLRIGQGLVNLRLWVSEPLLSAPFLSITPNNGVPIPVDLTKVSNLEYTGSFTVTESSPEGPAYAVFSARDFIGNRGTTINSGASFIIDAQGPAIISLDTQPEQPIKNDQANPVSITVTIGLNEALKPGTAPVISYLLSGPGRMQTTIAQPIQIATQPGHAQTWQGLFSLPADAGLTTPENVQFFYQGSDDLDNVSSRILCSNSFQVYQGNLPPLAPPANLAGKALAGGKVKLTWKGIAGAMGYRLYRKAPAESTLTPYQTLGNGSEFIDTAQPDGIFRYALAGLRKENNQESVSAMSNTVEVTSNSVPPEAPQDLILQLTGSGFSATWVSSPHTEPVTYSLYRSNLPEITSVQGMTAVLTGITATSAVDAHPSHTDHSYVVTAVDSAGNESSPSNSFYLNFDLLPVSTLQVVQTDNQPPVISWTHSGGDIAGYNLYLGSGRSQKLNTSIITGLSYADSGYTGDERQYTVTALDNNGKESLGRTLLLPKMYWELKAGEKIRRGIMNSLDYTVNNHSVSKIEHVRLKALVSTYPHQSQEFMVDPNSFQDVSVPVGGFAELPGLVTLATTLEIIPEEGALVQIVRSQEIGVVDDKLILQIRNESFTRGGLGKIWFTLENTGQEEIEIITAKGGSASDEVTISLVDADGNVFSSQAYKQNTGANVVTLSNNDTVARIPVGSLFTSDPIELPIPLTAPDQVIVRVEIGKIRFHYTQPDQISINGLNTQTLISLKDPAYNGTITTITPENSTGDQDILITGRAMGGNNLPVPSVPLKIVITVSGFERSYTVITDNQGNFTFPFRPSSGDSGVCKVRAVHPEVFDKPVQGQFIIGRLAIDPLTVNLTIPKNYEQTVNIRVTASEGISATDLRLVYEAQDQDSGLIPPGLQVTPGPALTLGPKQLAMLSVKIWADNTAASSGRVFLRLKSAEDDSWGKVVINTVFSEAGPALWSTPDHLETGVAYNQIVTENITLENKGMTALTDVSLSLITESGGKAPNWVRLNSLSFIGDLAVGDKRQVSLSFSPTTIVAEGIYPFLLRVVSSNYQTTDIRVYVSVSQAGLGNVIFKVSDIYTGQIQNNQLIQGLAGAKVTVQKETTLQEQSQTTDGLGEVFISDLSAGTYKYRVTAANHQEQIGRLWIKPGITLSQQVFLPYNLVTVEWEVRETTIKDKYEIVLQATYETNVPAPVVVMEPKSITLPTMQAGQVFNGEITITNYGLVRADNLKVTAPPSDQYFKYEFLKGLPQSLAAAERLVIPYRVTALRSTDQADEGSGSGGGCSSYLARAAVQYSYQCANGTNSEGWDYSYFTYLWGDSCSRSSTPIHYGGSGGSSGGSGSISGPPSQPISGTICPGPRQCALNDPCCNDTREAVHSFVDVLRGEYTDTVTDMAVKVLGHSVEVKRIFFDDQWHFDGDYLKLSITYGSLGNITSIMKDGVRYEPSDTSGKVFAFKTDRNIYVKDNGYRWETKSGDWSEHDPSGRMMAYGNRNNVKVFLLYEGGATGKLLGLADHAGTQVLWYEYDSNGSVSAVRDGTGRRVQYYYDGSKRLIKVRDVLGHDTLYTYDGAGRMTSKQDAAGRTYTIIYNEYGFVKSVSNENNLGTFFDYGYDAGSQERYVQIKYSSGRIVEKWVDRFGNIIRTALNGRTIESVLVSGRNKTFTDAAGNKTQKEYDARDNLIRQLNPDGTIISYEYEPRFNQVIREVNERGIVSRYEYDTTGNLLRKIEAYGTGSQRITENTYDASGNPLSMKTLGDAKTAEAVTVMTYDGSGNTTSVIDPEGNGTSFTYDAVGNLHTRVDARNKTWTYGYDLAGRVLSVTDPLGNSTSLEYDGVGNKTKETDPEGRERVYLYDPENRVIRSTESAGTAITQFSYNADGKLLRQVDPEGRETRFEYDLDGRLTKSIDGNGNQIVNVYADAVGGSSCTSCSGGGAAGQPSKTVFPTFTRTYAYDSRGRKVQETDVLSDTESTLTQSAYDGTGNLLSQIDKEGKTTIYQYDELRRRVKVIDPLNQITEYSYDNRGNLISLKDAKGNITTFEYDRNNRPTKETRPLGQATRYFYNPVGSLDYKIDAKNQKIAYEYDDAGRMIRTKVFSSSGDSTPLKTVDFTYSPSGNLLSYNDGKSSAGYTYDDVHRKLSETVNYGAFELTYAYAYYKNGLKKGLTMPDGTRYDYTYDAGNQISTIGIPGQGVMTYNRYKWTMPETVTLPGGIKRETGYTPLMQPKTISVKTPAQSPLMTYEYTYSPAGNITAKNTEGGNYAYQYDPLYRLISAANPGNTEAFTYDPVGNRLTTAIGGQPSADSYTHNANNELLSYDGVSYEYDANGNTISKTDSTGTTTFTYDIDNRLQLVTGQPQHTTYYYDPFGRRLWKEVNGIRTHYFYSDEGLIGEYSAAGTEIKTYGYAPNSTWTTNPLFQKIGTNYYYYQNDHLGTPQKMTDSNGLVVWSTSYDAFGKAQIQIGAIENNLRFPGQYYDAESGLRYNYHRYYDPKTGRYISEDPIRLKGGINLYDYTANNPVNRKDLRGLTWFGTNWCGPGGAGRLTGCYDGACKRHDECYDRCGIDATTRWYPGNLLGGCASACDKTLLMEWKDCACSHGASGGWGNPGASGDW